MDWLWRLVFGVSGEELRLALRHYWQSHWRDVLLMLFAGSVGQVFVAALQLQPRFRLETLHFNLWLLAHGFLKSSQVYPWPTIPNYLDLNLRDSVYWGALFPLVLIATVIRLPAITNYPPNLEERALALPRRVFAALLCLAQALLLACILHIGDEPSWYLLAPGGRWASYWTTFPLEIPMTALRFLVPGLVVTSLLDLPFVRPRQFYVAAAFWLLSSLLLGAVDSYRFEFNFNSRQLDFAWVLLLCWPLAGISSVFLLLRGSRCVTFCAVTTLTTLIVLLQNLLFAGKYLTFFYCLAFAGLPATGLFPGQQLIEWYPMVYK